MSPYLLILLLAGLTAASTDFNQNSSLALSYEQIQNIQKLLEPMNLYENLKKAAEGEPKCFAAVLSVIGGILKFKPWALQMFDATAKFPEGLLTLNHEYLGQYDECLKVTSPNGFTGQHCLMKGELHIPSIPSIPSNLPLVFFYGLCVPSACNVTQVDNTFSFIEKATKGLITFDAEEENCHVRTESNEPSDGDWVFAAFLAILGLCGIFSTVYDAIMQRKKKKGHPLLTSFSIPQNLKSLFSVSSADGQFGCLNGIRVVSMMWVVIFHCFTFVTGAPVLNLTDVFAARKDDSYTVLVSAFLAVDSFLLVSGLLLIYSFSRSVARTNGYDYPLYYIHRYLRLTPSYAVVLFFQITLFQYLGDGPMWHIVTNRETGNCKDYWWSSLLYVQNFVNTNDLCLTQTWYLAADMQLHWLSPLLFYPMLKWKKLAPYLLSLVIAIFTFIPFALTYVKHFSPIPLYDTTGDQDQYDNYATYSRATPWFVGVALGYLIVQLKERKIKVEMSPIMVLCGWAVSAVVAGFSLFGLMFFNHDDTGYHYGDQSVSVAFYVAFHRLGWALALAWLVFACINGYGGYVDDFLSWGPFQALGKLSFSVYLVHSSVIMYKFGVLQNNFYMDLKELIFIFLGIWIVSHFFGLLLYIFVEAPFFIIDRHLLRNAKIFPYPKPNPKKSKELSPRQATVEVFAQNGKV